MATASLGLAGEPPRKANPCKTFGVCPGCGKERELTQHHVFPVRFFGRSRNEWTEPICRNCHSDLEKMIPDPIMPLTFYYKVMADFGIGQASFMTLN